MNKPKKSTVLYKNGLIKCVLQNTKENENIIWES